VVTPAYQQYLQLKRQHPDCVLFFQLGDFYETFDDDAKTLSTVCDVVLTSRDFGKTGRRPLAGVPVRSADGHLARLVGAGYKVAVVDQVQQTGGPATTLRNSQLAAARAGAGPAPKTERGLFERVVAKIVTPGTVLDPAMLEAKANNYLMSIVTEGKEAGLAYADISTGEFFCMETPVERLETEIERIGPAEILLPDGAECPGASIRPLVTELSTWQYELSSARDAILKQFEVATLEAFGCADSPLAVRAAGGLLAYLRDTQPGSLKLLSPLITVSGERTMTLDAPTRRNLELSRGLRTEGANRAAAGANRAGTLLSVLDLTKTAMGGRLLRRWMFAPLLDLEPLLARQGMVAALYGDAILRANLDGNLAKLADIERILQRVHGGQAGPREVAALRRSLEMVPAILESISGDPDLALLAGRIDACADVAERISKTIFDDPPPVLADGGVIRPGWSSELDGLVASGKDGRAYIASLERRERERTGIASLKVGFNKVFGYYIEISHANISKVPPEYIRKQTLVGAERYITPDMKEVEALVLNSQEKIVELETRLFKELCQRIGEARERIRETAIALAELDVYVSLAETAVRRGYVRPELNEGDEIVIRGGRHPVVETTLEDQSFVPNDTLLSCDEAQLLILTGPNMAGKSIYIRQVALIVLLAQIGSFVPADSATIGIVDRIFTRVGAQDDPTAGQSTFMVEMAETANILHHATSRSLIILDEIGRGTSTYDGLAIARAIVEYIHDHPRLGAKTLFATHYHELSALEGLFPRVRNYRMDVLEDGERVVFLHRVVAGGADRSYGIYVARLAGIPRHVIQRAEEILNELEEKAAISKPAQRDRAAAKAGRQLALLPLEHPLVEQLTSLNVDAMTPLEAMQKLYELQKQARGKR
jgi:DNA mismatch repair protein MutS